MKRIFGIALVLAVVASLALGSVALADDPTTTDVNWDGSGRVRVGVNSGDAKTDFFTWGGYIRGSFTAKDFNDNPYNYTVDTFSTYANAYVQDGFIEYVTDRLASKESMYGPPGQRSQNFLVVTGGWGKMAMGSRTNFAQQEDSLYTLNRVAGILHEFEVNATYYEIYRWINDSKNQYAFVQALGSGSAWLDCMGSRIYATEARLGWGDGNYTDAQFHAVGSGTFLVSARGSNQIRTPIADQYGNLAPGGWVIPGNGTFGSCAYSVIATFAGTFDVGNYSVQVK